MRNKNKLTIWAPLFLIRLEYLIKSLLGIISKLHNHKKYLRIHNVMRIWEENVLGTHTHKKKPWFLIFRVKCNLNMFCDTGGAPTMPSWILKNPQTVMNILKIHKRRVSVFLCAELMRLHNLCGHSAAHSHWRTNCLPANKGEFCARALCLNHSCGTLQTQR